MPESRICERLGVKSPGPTYLVVTINGRKHWLWRAVDQHGAVLNVLVQSRRDRHAARRLMRNLLRKHGRTPRLLITDKLRSYATANHDRG